MGASHQPNTQNTSGTVNRRVRYHPGNNPNTRLEEVPVAMDPAQARAEIDRLMNEIRHLRKQRFRVCCAFVCAAIIPFIVKLIAHYFGASDEIQLIAFFGTGGVLFVCCLVLMCYYRCWSQ